MNPLDFALVADENIAPELVAALRERRIDVYTLRELGLSGAEDVDILSRAHSGSRVVLTHDADFGLLAVRRQVPFTGVIFLRPGHIKTSFSLEALSAAACQFAVADLHRPLVTRSARTRWRERRGPERYS